ncbi:hypothetical protein BLX87_02645, partial [Bacillus sp. VT-16-64]
RGAGGRIADDLKRLEHGDANLCCWVMEPIFRSRRRQWRRAVCTGFLKAAWAREPGTCLRRLRQRAAKAALLIQ